jgi:hypothetical protein
MYTTPDKKIAIEHYTGTADTRAKLHAEGFAFIEQDFFNNFWGVRFLVEMPRGKGATARRNRLQEINDGK